MEAKHTPGPWAYGPTGETMQRYSQPFGIIEHGTKNLIAGVFGDVKGGEKTAKANAKLISQAPAMLDALKDIAQKEIYQGKIQFTVEDQKQLLALIKAATE